MLRGCLFVMYKTNFPPESIPHRDQAPNKIIKSGRDTKIVYSLEPYIAVTVSPFHAAFSSQVESGVWDLVRSLNDKGYNTVSSCEGHYDQDIHKGSPMVIVAFTNNTSRDLFVSRVSEIPGTLIEQDIQFNVEYDPMSETFHKSTGKINVSFLNELFMKDSDYYTLVRVQLNKFTGYDPIRWADRYIFKNKICVQRMMSVVKGLPQL